MMFWVGWSRWNSGHPVLFLSWAIPVTQVATRATWVSPGDGYVPRKRTRWKMLKGASGVGQFFVTGPTDVATKPSHFYCRTCRKDVSVLTHGHHEEILRRFQDNKQFPRDQRLRLETPGWEVLDYERNAMSPAEVERQREKIMKAPMVVRDREYPFSEDGIADETGAVDPNLGVMAKVSSLNEVLRLGGSYQLVYQLWVHFTLSSVRVNLEVTWSRDEVFVSIYICSVYSTWPVCIQFVDCFSPCFWTGRIRGFCLAVSNGQSQTGVAAWSLRRKVTRCGCFFARGR